MPIGYAMYTFTFLALGQNGFSQTKIKRFAGFTKRMKIDNHHVLHFIHEKLSIRSAFV